jgi:hypothetical protein
MRVVRRVVNSSELRRLLARLSSARDTIERQYQRYSQAIQEDALSSYWQSPTEPHRLARSRHAREEGLSYTVMSEIISQRYSTPF